jgi:hypothetical protein
MEGLSLWLSQTSLNGFLREQLGFLAALQAVHIMAVAMVGSSVLMIDLRLLGVAERSQTVTEVARRFVPWLWGGLVVLTLTAIPLIIAEPQRDLTNWTFQLKMAMIALGVAITISFVRSLHYTNHTSADRHSNGSSTALTHTLAIFTLVLFVAIAVAGRWIGYTWHG